MAIAHVATEYVFSDFLLKDPTDAKYKGMRLELAADKIVTFLAVGLPLFLISLAFAQEVSVVLWGKTYFCCHASSKPVDNEFGMGKIENPDLSLTILGQFFSLNGHNFPQTHAIVFYNVFLEDCKIQSGDQLHNFNGTQISCFAPTNFSWRQAAYVDSFCWAAVQQQDDGSPLWLHKFFPYILLSLAILVYIPALFWRFTAAPHLSSDLNFIMEELDRFYNRAIKLAKNLASLDAKDKDVSQDTQSNALELAEGCFKYPLVEQYLKTKRFSHRLVIMYLACRGLTLLILLLACLYLGYYIRLASLTDEFPCDLRTGVLTNDSRVPSAVQCKLVAVGVFRLLSYINLGVYVLLAPMVVYAAVGPARQSSNFLRPYEMLPGFGALGVITPFYNDLSIYLLFLQENLSELKSFKCLQVLELLQEAAEEGFDTMCLLRTLGQVKTDVLDCKKACPRNKDKEVTS